MTDHRRVANTSDTLQYIAVHVEFSTLENNTSYAVQANAVGCYNRSLICLANLCTEETSQQPQAAALHWCNGGYPGIGAEMAWQVWDKTFF